MSNIISNEIHDYGMVTEKGKNCTRILFTYQPDSCSYTYEVLPGILLGINQIRMHHMYYPNTEDIRKKIRVNYGIHGQSNQILTNGIANYVSKGDLVLSSLAARDGFVFPEGYYDGIELVIDPEIAGKQSLSLLQSWGIDLVRLQARYQKTGIFKASHIPSIDNLMEQIWEIPRDDSEESYSKLCIATLEFLRLLLYEDIPESSYHKISQEHTRMAREYEAILTSRLDEHITARDMADEFGISETSLKNYFKIVFGENISSYMKKYRMNTAEKLLRESDKSIAEISAQVGYSGQNKFAAAFRSYYGLNPLEYRKEKST